MGQLTYQKTRRVTIVFSIAFLAIVFSQSSGLLAQNSRDSAEQPQTFVTAAAPNTDSSRAYATPSPGPNRLETKTSSRTVPAWKSGWISTRKILGFRPPWNRSPNTIPQTSATGPSQNGGSAHNYIPSPTVGIADEIATGEARADSGLFPMVPPFAIASTSQPQTSTASQQATPEIQQPASEPSPAGPTLPVNPLVTDTPTSQSQANAFKSQLEAFPKSTGDGMLSTEKMVGNLADNSQIFSKLHVANDYRIQPAHLSQSVRTHAHATEGVLLWPLVCFTWTAPAMSHKPLYFEQVNLERYGYGTKYCLTPIASAAHFFGSIALLPYKVTTQHPNEMVYSLGHDRPGNRAQLQRRTLFGQSYPGEVLKYWTDAPHYR